MLESADPLGQLGAIQGGYLMAYCKACFWQAAGAARKFDGSWAALALR